jgi:hypothetical protein
VRHKPDTAGRVECVDGEKYRDPRLLLETLAIAAGPHREPGWFRRKLLERREQLDAC